jgi:hypothetical protein
MSVYLLAAVEDGGVEDSLHLVVLLHARLEKRQVHTRRVVLRYLCRYVLAGAAEHEGV